MSRNAGCRKPGEMEVHKCARRLALHSSEKCMNENKMPMAYERMTKDICDTAIEIYADALTANAVKVETASDLRLRRHYQNRAIARCARLNALLEMAGKVYPKLTPREVRYWGGLCTDTKRLLRSWRDSDQRRYGRAV